MARNTNTIRRLMRDARAAAERSDFGEARAILDAVDAEARDLPSGRNWRRRSQMLRDTFPAESDFAKSKREIPMTLDDILAAMKSLDDETLTSIAAEAITLAFMAAIADCQDRPPARAICIGLQADDLANAISSRADKRDFVPALAARLAPADLKSERKRADDFGRALLASQNLMIEAAEALEILDAGPLAHRLGVRINENRKIIEPDLPGIDAQSKD